MSPTQVLSRRTRSSSGLTELLEDPGSMLRTTLDSLNANCFVADLGLNLVFMNRKASATLRQFAPVVQTTFGIGPEELLGGSIHRFHSDPARIESLLSDPKELPREATFTFGDVTLHTLINAVIDPTGTRHGYIVIWNNVSERNAAASRAVEQVSEYTTRFTEVARGIAEVAGRNSAEANQAATAPPSEWPTRSDGAW